FVGVMMPWQFRGFARPLNFIRLRSDGSVDTNFKPLKDSIIQAVGLTPDGCIVAASSYLHLLKSDGTLSKQLPVRANGIVGIVIQLDHNILIAGGFGEVNGVPRRSVARVYGTDQTPVVHLFGPFLSSHGFEISVPTVTNRLYHLEFSEGLETAQWKPL